MSVREATHSDHLVNGLPVPFFVTESTLLKLKDTQLFLDDVWIVAYPKCGTTWTQQIVRSLLDKQDLDVNIDRAIPWLEASSSDPGRRYVVNAEDIKRPRAFKSHMPYHRMPCGSPDSTPGRYIYVARNPKDVAVSYFHHYFSLQRAHNFTWDVFLTWFLNGELGYGDYVDHVLSWWQRRGDNNVLFLKYEDMKSDITASATKIASFLNINISDELIQKTIEVSSFSSMKTNPTTSYEWLSLHPQGTPFIRKGTVGDWKSLFSSEQSARFDSLDREKFQQVGLQLKYE